MDKIAIIIGRNTESAHLENCIESVIRQSSGSWELYLPEQADNSDQKIVKSNYKENSKIHFVEEAAGLSYAELHNKMIEDTDCEIIGLLDGNDSLNEFCVEKVLHFYEAFCNTGLIYTNYMITGQDNQPKSLGNCIPLKPWQNLLDHKSFGPFISLKKQYFNLTKKFNSELAHAEEIDIAYKLGEVSRHYFINEPLYNKRELEGLADQSTEILKQKNIITARQNAFKRRGLPDTDNPFLRLLNMDYYSAKKLKYKKGKKVIDPVIGIENLVSAKKILDKFNMKNWLTDGTLLGYYRDNKFIVYDDDLDVGCFISEYDGDIIAEFLRDGWDIDRIFGRYEMGLEISVKRSNLKLDIFFFYEEDGKFWHGAWEKTGRGWNLIKYYYNPFDLKEVEYMGHQVNIPANTEAYVTTKYGETWNKVVKEWDWAHGPSNSVKTDYYL